MAPPFRIGESAAILAGVPDLTRSYGERLGVLSGEQLQGVCDRFGLGRALAAAPVPQGLFGQNVFLSTTAGEFVLRGRPHYDWQLPKERLVARLIHEGTTLESPWPYHVEPDPALLGWPYAVMRRVPGVVEGAEGAEEDRQVARALGRALAELHALEADAPACYDGPADAFVPFQVSQEERIVGQVHALREAVRDVRAEAMGPDDDAWIDAVVESARPALRDPFRARYVHHDFKPNNVLCERTATGWTARGVVDLMEGYFGDPEEDLVRCAATLARADAGLARAFVAVYAHERPLRPGHRERYRAYQVLDCLVLWEYGQRHGLWFQPAWRFRDFAAAWVDLDPFPAPG